MATTASAPVSPFKTLESAHLAMSAAARGLQARLLGTILSTVLFGILALCTCVTVVMISRTLRKTRWAMWYTLATIAMFASTTVYWAFMLHDTFAIAGASTSIADSLNHITAWVDDCLLEGGSCDDLTNPAPLGPDMVQFTFNDINLPVEYCVGTAALTTNIIIGDAIVLGRVYVVWPRNRLIRLALGFLLLGTAATGAVSTARSCRRFDGSTQVPLLPEDRPGLGSFVGPSAGNLLGSFFEGDPSGVAASVLSLTTNVVSTCLIGWQAWKHRALVRGNGLKSYLGRSQVSKALVLLIESGVFYSVIWIFVVAYQIVALPSYANYYLGPVHSSAFQAFTAGWEAFTEGALVTVIAIYPTVIMLVVALNRSECDAIASRRGDAKQDAGGVPSLVVRGSILQSINFVDNGSAGGRPSASFAEDVEFSSCSLGHASKP
ncbi:hypothetical protein V8D89_007030 [Ganoderma adspersum]